MRGLILAVAGLFLAGCGDVAETGSEAAGADGYAVEIRANSGEVLYIVTAPDGRTAGARSADNVSTLVERNALRALAAEPAAAEDEREETVSVRAPGFSLSVRGNPDAEGTGEQGGRVQLSVGGERVVIDVDEGTPGDEADDRANVRLSGLSEAEIRDLVAKADDLSPSVQAQLLGELGLE